MPANLVHIGKTPPILRRSNVMLCQLPEETNCLVDYREISLSPSVINGPKDGCFPRQFSNLVRATEKTPQTSTRETRKVAGICRPPVQSIALRKPW